MLQPVWEHAASAVQDPSAEPLSTLRVVVLIPCHNEALTVVATVHAFRRALPHAKIYVYDNNSSDDTARLAAAAGAEVRFERLQGKGNVVRRMFSDIDADIYVMADGDNTYDASAAPRLIATLLSGPYDMVNAVRKHAAAEAYRPGHVLGNRLLTGLVRLFFGAGTDDMLSGYKAFSRRFVKSFPALSRGFEIETELMVHALDLQLPIAEIEASYQSRPAGSTSKLNTFRDGFRILKLVGWVLKHDKPLLFFGQVSGLLATLSLILGGSVAIEFYETGLVPRLPTAVLAAAIMLAAFMSFFTGLILDTVTRSRREMKRLHYQGQPSPLPVPAQHPAKTNTVTRAMLQA